MQGYINMCLAQTGRGCHIQPQLPVSLPLELAQNIAGRQAVQSTTQHFEIYASKTRRQQRSHTNNTASEAIPFKRLDKGTFEAALVQAHKSNDSCCAA